MVKLIFFLLSFIFPSHVFAATDEVELKANFIFRFAQFTTWPPPPNKETLLCVLGSRGIYDELDKFKDRKINGNSVRVLNISSIKSVADCHVLFVGAQERINLSMVLALPILVIGESAEAFDKKVIIVLVTEPNRISFKINRSQASNVGLVMSAQLLKLAKEVR
ncbi:YfiR family protein [Iodobacter ciconiae]|uniref:YfiR family protein n=1 Tax=Iodobacter ciconiae TaxID=2496266 RepID=A0A3S8ZT94_9NEIS|nr:YfiR family protein [Iodobacter ciconiae]AZN36674.1 YfiR family protein [Iodobacter ciconiae]